jgi:hypothetical protein
MRPADTICNPFRPGARLARAAPAQEQPDAPIAAIFCPKRRKLPGMGLIGPAQQQRRLIRA